MATKFGLGRGLKEIGADMGNMPNISVLTGAERVAVRSIPLAQIGANPDQPRKTFNDAELGDLAASIREKGVLQPILLRSVTGRAHMYEIVAGERRYRASKMAGLTDIPALVKTINDDSAMEIALIENVQRENLNAIEEAAAYRNLMEKIGYGLDDVARLIGKSASYIRNMMRLESLPESVKQRVENGEISPSHARTILLADDPAALAQEIIDKKLSVSDTETLVKSRSFRQKTSKRPGNFDNLAEIRALEQKIRKNTGLFVKIRERKGGAGDIVISFSSRIHRDEIVEKLGIRS